MTETNDPSNPKICLNCGNPFTGRSLKRFCSVSCAQKYIHAHREEWDTGITQTRDFKYRAPNPNLHQCHGWSDRKGTRHDCRKMVTDYRCRDCWAKHRRVHGGSPSESGCPPEWENA